MKFMRLENGRVAEIVEIAGTDASADDLFHPDLGFVAHEAGAEVGMVKKGKGWSMPPPPPIIPAPAPSSVTLAQARVALRRAGLFDTADAAIRAIGGEALDAWEYANGVSRSGALVTSIGPELGLSPEQIDDLFRAAAAIDF